MKKDTLAPEIEVEKEFKTGDFMSTRGDHSKAIEIYSTALSKHKIDSDRYPNAFYNQAESQFILKKYPDSLNKFIEFVKKFPTHPHAPLAMTRIAELFELMGVDNKRSKGIYLETDFRYGKNDYSMVSKIKLLSLRMSEAKKKESDEIAQEILNDSKKFKTLEMPRFAAIMIADGYASRKDYKKSIQIIDDYLKENPLERKNELLTQRVVNYINLDIRNKVQEHNYISAIKTFDEYSTNWLKNTNRLDTQYSLATSLDVLGAKDKAETYYKNILNTVYSIQNTNEAKLLEAHGTLPSSDKINLSLASLNFSKKNQRQAYEYLKNIKNPESLVLSDQIDRVSLLAQIFEDQGDYATAVRYLRELIVNSKGQPEKLTQIYYNLAEIDMKVGKRKEALESLGIIRNLLEDSANEEMPLMLKVLQMQSKIYDELHDTDNYVSTTERLLSLFEEKYSLASVRFKLGETFFKKGELKKASEVWGLFKGKDTQFWSNLSQEKLKEAQWGDDYKKYLKRIPAMSQSDSSAKPGGQ